MSRRLLSTRHLLSKVTSELLVCTGAIHYTEMMITSAPRNSKSLRYSETISFGRKWPFQFCLLVQLKDIVQYCTTLYMLYNNCYMIYKGAVHNCKCTLKLKIGPNTFKFLFTFIAPLSSRDQIRMPAHILEELSWYVRCVRYTLWKEGLVFCKRLRQIV